VVVVVVTDCGRPGEIKSTPHGDNNDKENSPAAVHPELPGRMVALAVQRAEWVQWWIAIRMFLSSCNAS